MYEEGEGLDEDEVRLSVVGMWRARRASLGVVFALLRLRSGLRCLCFASRTRPRHPGWRLVVYKAVKWAC